MAPRHEIFENVFAPVAPAPDPSLFGLDLTEYDIDDELELLADAIPMYD